jgi:glycerophosphoryl diester phosphodiesterase
VDGADGRIAWEAEGGITPTLSGTASDGDFIYTSATPGEADVDPVRTTGAMGRVVTVGDTGDPLYVEWWGVPDSGGGTSSGSSVTVDHVLSAHRFPIAAHRGDIGSADSFPEDSMEALRQAALKGAEIVGWDAVQSSDGTFWGSHDTTVDRVTASSGAISGKTDATLAGYTYNAGYGYDAGRHGSSIGLSTLDDILTAIEQYGCLLTIELKGGSPADLAQAIVDAGWAARTIIEVSDLTDAATVKGVDPTLTVLVNQSVSGSETDANVNWLSWDSSTLASLSSAQAKAPKVIKAYQSITDYGVDETTPFNNAWDFGARSYQANNLDQVLSLRDALFYGSVVALDDLSDVTITTPSAGQGLLYDGAEWVNQDITTTTHWEVLMTDGISNPPDPLLNEAGDDWLYGEVT